jgi:hypothetical protein
MPSATAEGTTALADSIRQLFGCGWLVVTTSVLPGEPANSTA